MRRATTIVMLVGALLISAAAGAHSGILGSTPRSGAILAASPPSIDVAFNEITRLTSVVLVNEGGERRLEFAPTGAAERFSIQRPDLKPGRNEVRWRALSRDGHVVAGSIILVVKPGRR